MWDILIDLHYQSFAGLIKAINSHVFGQRHVKAGWETVTHWMSRGWPAVFFVVAGFDVAFRILYATHYHHLFISTLEFLCRSDSVLKLVVYRFGAYKVELLISKAPDIYEVIIRIKNHIPGLIAKQLVFLAVESVSQGRLWSNYTFMIKSCILFLGDLGKVIPITISRSVSLL